MRTHAHTRAHMHTNTHARRLPGWRPWAELLGLVRKSRYALCLYMSTSLRDIRQSCSIGQGRYTRWAGQRLRAKPRRGTRDLANHPAGSRFESELEPLPRRCQPGCRWRWDPWPASLPPLPVPRSSWPGGGDPGRPWAAGFSGREHSGSGSYLCAGSAQGRCGGGRLGGADRRPHGGGTGGEIRPGPRPAGPDLAKLVGPNLPERITRPPRTGKLAGMGALLSPHLAAADGI